MAGNGIRRLLAASSNGKVDHSRNGNSPRPHRWQAKPITKFVQSLLEDGEWHDYAELKAQVDRDWTGPVPKPGGKKYANPTRQQCINYAVSQAVNGAQIYEVEKHPQHKRAIWRVRKRPGARRYQTVASCQRCGRYGLTIDQRVRRTVRFEMSNPEAPKPSTGRASNLVLGVLPTEIICIPCFKEELQLKGGVTRKGYEQQKLDSK